MKKYSKKELNKIMKFVDRRIYIGEETYYEKFKQIKVDNVYIPYVISSFGRIFSLYFGKSTNFNVKELNTNSNGTNYVKISINYDNKHYNFWIHRLVGEAFLKRGKYDTEVNHKDGIGSNNYVWNLEWCTHKENVEHAELNGLTNHPKGEQNHSKHSELTIIKVCQAIENNRSPKYIIKKYDISKNVFQSILHNRKWKHISKDYDFTNYIYLRNKS